MTIDSTLPRVLHVAVFECLKLSGAISQHRGQFGDVFRAWLDAATISYNKKCVPSERITIQTSHWDIREGKYPISLEFIDAIIVTGSTASAYDKELWICKLSKYLQDVYINSPRVRIYGGCFGHQLVAQTLLGDHGVKVELSPKGWEIGVQETFLNPEFAAHFPAISAERNLFCQYLHADHVVLPQHELPGQWISLGSSRLCDVQGMYEPGRVLTYQGHPEFDSFLNEEAVKNLGNNNVLKADQVEEAIRSIRQADSAILYGEILLAFFADKYNQH